MTRLLVAWSVLAVFAEGTSLARPCPNVMLVLDRSGSMAADPSGREPTHDDFKGPSKWEMLKQVVIDIVAQHGDRVPFGLVLYSGTHSRRPPGPDDECYTQTMLSAPVAHDSAGAILAALRAATPEGETGTNGAIRRARLDPGLKDQKKSDLLNGKGNFIILITDGDPNCGSDAILANNNEDQALSAGGRNTVDEIDAAFKQKPSIGTYVIGFDGDPAGVKTVNLDNMAYYGLGGKMQTCTTPPNHCYYTAGVNFADFKKALDEIVTEVGGGEFGGSLCDDSCYSNPCPQGEICTTNEQNTAPHCEPDMCMGAKCGGDTFCRLGKCIRSCKRPCGKGSVCIDGDCQQDLCSDKTCGASQVCHPKNGTCIDFPCPNCNVRGSYCDVQSGKCLSDGCKIGTIHCPGGFRCVNHNNCESNGGLGGCRVTSGSEAGFDPSGLAWAGLLFSLSLVFRRRARNAG